MGRASGSHEGNDHPKIIELGEKAMTTQGEGTAGECDREHEGNMMEV